MPLPFSLNKDNLGEVWDKFGGRIDLDKKNIRTPLDPNITFSDDPLRMMRAIRFATQLGFTIEKATFESIRRNSKRIRIISQERITDELNKIILAKKPSLGFKLMLQAELLQIIFPKFCTLLGIERVGHHGHKDNFYHTLEVLDNLSERSEDLFLRWAAILHDIAKPQTKRYHKKQGWTFHAHDFIGAKMVKGIFQQFKLPLYRVKYVEKLVRLHLRPIALVKDEVTDTALRRLLFDAGDDIDDLMMLCRSDVTSKNDKKVEKYLQNFDKVEKRLGEVEERDRVRNFQPVLTGEVIIKALNIKPSREVGIIKNAIKEAILEGTISNDYQEAYDFMIKIAKERKLIS